MSRRHLPFAGLLALAVGCSSENPRKRPVEEPTVSGHICVTDFFLGMRWPGARVSVLGDDIAPAYADESGCATLRSLPAHAELSIAMTVPGLTPMNYTFVTGTRDIEIVLQAPQSEWAMASSLSGQLDFNFDPAAGIVGAFVTENLEPIVSSLSGIPGVTPRLVTSDAGSLAGPFFNQGATAWAIGATTSTDTGLMIFFGVPVGDQEIELHFPPGFECTVGYDEQWGEGLSWPSTIATPRNTVRFRTISVSGFYTASAIRCARVGGDR